MKYEKYEPSEWIFDLSWSNSIFRAEESGLSDRITLSGSSSWTETSALIWENIRARKIEKITSFENAIEPKITSTKLVCECVVNMSSEFRLSSFEFEFQLNLYKY